MRSWTIRVTAGVFLLSFFLSSSGSSRVPDGDVPMFAPGQLVVQFEPGIIDLPVKPPSFLIPLEQVPIRHPTLGASLREVGIEQFQVFAPGWRAIPDPPPAAEDYVPASLCSFRNWYILQFSPRLDLDYMAERMRELPGMVSVGRNPTLELNDYWPEDEYLECPGDTCGRNYQWNLMNTGGTVEGVECEEGFDIGLARAYEYQSQATVKIGLLDTCVDATHDDLTDNIDFTLARKCSSDSGCTPSGWNGTWAGHGTHAAGLLGVTHDGDGTIGICGQSAGPVIVPLMIWPNGVSPTESARCTYLINALCYAMSQGVELPIVTNQSTLHHDREEGYLTDADVRALASAIWNSYHSNTLIVNSAGNDASDDEIDLFPQDFTRMVVGVTAVGCDGSRPAGFAHGARRISLSAPSSANVDGDDVSQVLTTDPGDDYTFAQPFGGTSAAAPHVAAVAGLLLSETSATVTPTNEDLREIMQRTALSLGGQDTFGHGLIRADEALERLNEHALIHATTNDIDGYNLVESCVVVSFANTAIPGSPRRSNSPTPIGYKVDIYEFHAEVPLLENEEPGYSPQVWVRGRESVSARNVYQSGGEIYDGRREPYWGEVVTSDHDSALLRGYTYKIYGIGGDCTPDSLHGWFPFNVTNPPANVVKFAFSYTADPAGEKRASERLITEGSGGDMGTRILRRGSSVLSFSPCEARRADFRMYDVSGRVVASLAMGPEDLRRGTLDIGRVLGRGKRVPAGVYVGVLEGGATKLSWRLVLLR
jgi:hypothetical protein